MTKEKYLEAIDELQKNYDAFCYFVNKSKGVDTYYQKEFELLSNLKGECVGNVLSWIRHCYYGNDDNAFNYLRGVVNEID